jgi:DNA-binding response OmpR family regulator
MIVILDERECVRQGYVSCFEREGVAATALSQAEFLEWFEGSEDPDIEAIEGFLLGRGCDWISLPRSIGQRATAPIICILDERSLKDTLAMFAAGADDIVTKPIHVREILARVTAIRERSTRSDKIDPLGEIQTFCNGRDPIVAGDSMILPRRERRILECLAASEGLWLTKSQIFRRVYGIFNAEIDENVIESHISRLRKRLRERLKLDPIESQRYLGYRLKPVARPLPSADEWKPESFTQANDGPISVDNVSPH